MKAHSEQSPEYVVTRDEDDATVAKALAILSQRLKTGRVFNRPDDIKAFLQIELAQSEHECFAVLFLDAQHQLIEFKNMFRGTLTQTSVYPREIVKEALRLNAGAVVFSHNHPSGSVTPSKADETLTRTLKSALALVDVRVLDHIIVSMTGSMSMAEKGLL